MRGQEVSRSFCSLGQNLNRANLRNSDLSGTVAWRLTFWSAQAEGASFSKAVLNGVDFGDANLHNANFAGAILVDADFRGSELEGSDFSSTFLQGANLRARSLKDINLRGALYDNKTAWPSEFDPIKAGANNVSAPAFGPVRSRIPGIVSHSVDSTRRSAPQR